MGFFKTLFGNRHFTHFDDAYALTREALWNSLQSTLESDRYADKPVETSLIDAKRFSYDSKLAKNGIRLVLANTLVSAEDGPIPAVDFERSLAIIVLERHPVIEHDLRIEKIARSLPVRVEYGHYLSLDDSVVRLVVNETTVKILQQLGMNDHELIASTMVTRRLKKVLRRMQSSFQFDHDADSAAEWIALNSRN
jgi:hypothetical protein